MKKLLFFILLSLTNLSYAADTKEVQKVTLFHRRIFSPILSFHEFTVKHCIELSRIIIGSLSEKCDKEKEYQEKLNVSDLKEKSGAHILKYDEYLELCKLLDQYISELCMILATKTKKAPIEILREHYLLYVKAAEIFDFKTEIYAPVNSENEGTTEDEEECVIC